MEDKGITGSGQRDEGLRGCTGILGSIVVMMVVYGIVAAVARLVVR